MARTRWTVGGATAAALGLGILGGTSGEGAGTRGDSAIDAVAPLAGHWRAELGGSVYEEFWMPPSHGQMTGVMRSFDAEGNVHLLELLTLREGREGLEYTLRHFDEQMKPWASESAGPLVMRADASDGRPVAFTPEQGGENLDSITLDVSQSGRFVATIAFKGDGARAPLVLEFTRVAGRP
ncbi:MAG: DUF6265 family protein [Phycisphaerales bacterium]